MKWLLIVCYLYFVSSSLYFFILILIHILLLFQFSVYPIVFFNRETNHAYSYTYFVVISFFFVHPFVIFNKETNHTRKSNFILVCFFSIEIFWKLYCIFGVEFIHF